jgi:hypothetical protein
MCTPWKTTTLATATHCTWCCACGEASVAGQRASIVALAALLQSWFPDMLVFLWGTGAVCVQIPTPLKI